MPPPPAWEQCCLNTTESLPDSTLALTSPGIFPQRSGTTILEIGKISNIGNLEPKIDVPTPERFSLYGLFFCYQQFFLFIFSHTTQHNIQNTKKQQQTHTQHLKVQSKERGRGKDNKNTKVTPLYNHVCPTKNTAKHQWSKAWPHRLALLYIHMTLFAGGYPCMVLILPISLYCLHIIFYAQRSDSI